MVAAVVVFIGLGTFIALFVGYIGQSSGNPIIRIIGLFICFVLASVVYNLIKVDTVEKEKSSVKSEDIASKLDEIKNNKT